MNDASAVDRLVSGLKAYTLMLRVGAIKSITNAAAAVIRRIDWRMTTSVFKKGFVFKASKTNLKMTWGGCQ